MSEISEQCLSRSWWCEWKHS